MVREAKLLDASVIRNVLNTKNELNIFLPSPWIVGGSVNSSAYMVNSRVSILK